MLGIASFLGPFCFRTFWRFYSKGGECGTKASLWLKLTSGFKDMRLSYGPPWAHYLSGYQDRLLGGPLGLPDLCRTEPVGVRRKDYGGEVLG
jgi:hypothetical protein